MSSSQPFISSPTGHVRRKSRFTYKHLAQLGLSSTACPLRVIALIDLDAFYAQCETVRLGLPEDQPLAVQQWSGLIAVNYPARKFGLTRFISMAEAKKLCPHIVFQHVATWKEGDEKWAYHPDAAANLATYKVSLDHYRLQSRRILACIRDSLPPTQRVEKASIDEVFLDLSAQVHSILIQRYPELEGPPPYDDPTENLPMPPSTAIDWTADALVDLDNAETEDDDPDWDDIAMQIGSEITRGVRARIRELLKYTSSAGIARNKMLSKLGSGYKKPDQQTVIRNRASQQFMVDFQLRKIRNLGGKLGEQVVNVFGADQVKDLLHVTIDQFKLKLGDDTGSWLYNALRGDEHSEVTSRTQIKSMLSAKSFQPSINSFEQAVRWLRIFVADIYSRLVEEGVLENKRRPRTMTLHHRQGGITRSRQMSIKAVDESSLFQAAKNLMRQVIVDGAWPCSNLSLSVGGFEDALTGNRKLDTFFTHPSEAQALSHELDDNLFDQLKPSGFDDDTILEGEHDLGDQNEMVGSTLHAGLEAKTRADDGKRIDDLKENIVPVGNSYIKQIRKPNHEHTLSEHDDESAYVEDTFNEQELNPAFQPLAPNAPTSNALPPLPLIAHLETASHLSLLQTSIDSFFCEECKKTVSTTRIEHEDWHFAAKLQSSESPARPPAGGTPSKPLKSGRIIGQKSGGRIEKGQRTGSRGEKGQKSEARIEKGQRRLTFGS